MVALTSVSLADGSVSRKTLFDRSEIQALAVPKLFEVDYDTRQLMIYAIWGYSKEKFGILKF